MTKAEELSHLSDMIRRSIDSLSANLNGFPAYLVRLEALADRGAFIAPGTTEEIRLEADAKALRLIADRMTTLRGDLLANESYNAEAAE